MGIREAAERPVLDKRSPDTCCSSNKAAVVTQRQERSVSIHLKLGTKTGISVEAESGDPRTENNMPKYTQAGCGHQNNDTWLSAVDMWFHSLMQRMSVYSVNIHAPS